MYCLEKLQNGKRTQAKSGWASDYQTARGLSGCYQMIGAVNTLNMWAASRRAAALAGWIGTGLARNG
jgi:hypothetical protein